MAAELRAALPAKGDRIGVTHQCGTTVHTDPVPVVRVVSLTSGLFRVECIRCTGDPMHVYVRPDLDLFGEPILVDVDPATELPYADPVRVHRAHQETTR